MITNTIQGCSYTDLWVSPANWQKATKKDLDKDWYVQCTFFDPRHEKKYPQGFPFRKRANKPQTIEERKALVSFSKAFPNNSMMGTILLPRST